MVGEGGVRGVTEGSEGEGEGEGEEVGGRQILALH